ncbi:hypothetical protein C8J57DRAFT_1340017 [Mycena rebaudengoi]|nr:hypothetical protein C8J57DRAFT_1340017 [Mycena rebaudengoi]
MSHAQCARGNDAASASEELGGGADALPVEGAGRGESGRVFVGRGRGPRLGSRASRRAHERTSGGETYMVYCLSRLGPEYSIYACPEAAAPTTFRTRTTRFFSCGIYACLWSRMRGLRAITSRTFCPPDALSSTPITFPRLAAQVRAFFDNPSMRHKNPSRD